MSKIVSGTGGLCPTFGKTHIALALGLAACQMVHETIEARDEKRLLRLQDQLARVGLLIVDELGYVPLSHSGSELQFDVFSRRYENGATFVTSNLPFQEWTTVFASERLTGALLDRLTHHVPFLEMNGDSYRLKQSRSRRRPPSELPRLPSWAHKPLPRAGQRQPRTGRVAPRGGLPWPTGTSYRRCPWCIFALPPETVRPQGPTPDGAYMFGNPTPAHYVARAHDLPVLFNVSNNAGRGAIRTATRAMYPDGTAQQRNAMPLTALDPMTAFETVVAEAAATSGGGI